MDRIPAEALAVKAEINRTLRLLMMDNPLDAEERAVDIPELRETDTSGEGALEFTAPNGSPVYIVYSRGTKYTTAVRPSHLHADKIKHVIPPKATNELWIRRQARCQFLEQLSKDTYEAFGVREIDRSEAKFSRPPH